MEDNFKVNVFYPVIDTTLMQLRERVKGMQMFVTRQNRTPRYRGALSSLVVTDRVRIPALAK